jgi:hypothetical protein
LGVQPEHPRAEIDPTLIEAAVDLEKPQIDFHIFGQVVGKGIWLTEDEVHWKVMGFGVDVPLQYQHQAQEFILAVKNRTLETEYVSNQSVLVEDCKHGIG